MLTFMWVAYYTALPHVDLSVAAAVYYTLPLFITLFAAVFIGERVGVRGWIAVFLGFCGVLLILRPRADDFNGYALLPLTSAVLYAFAMILTRTKCKNESPLVLSFGLNVSMIGVGVVATLFVALWGPSSMNKPCLSGLHPHSLGLEWAQTGYRGARHGCSRPRRSPIPAFASHQHLQAYLNEFTFRFNRRFYPFNAFRSLLGIAGDTSAPTYAELYSGEWRHPTCSGHGR